VLRELRHAGALGDVLSYQSVGVLVRAALPGVVWSGEVEGDTGALFDGGVVVELRAVIRGDGFEALWMPTDETQRSVIRMFLGASSELADHDVAGLAFDDGHETVTAACADDGVDFPVADLRALFGGERALADVSFTGETAAAVVGAVAFAALLASATQVGEEQSAEHSIAPDVSIDRFVADRQHAMQEQSPGDLLGAEPLVQQRIDMPQIGAREALITS